MRIFYTISFAIPSALHSFPPLYSTPYISFRAAPFFPSPEPTPHPCCPVASSHGPFGIHRGLRGNLPNITASKICHPCEITHGKYDLRATTTIMWVPLYKMPEAFHNKRKPLHNMLGTLSFKMPCVISVSGTVFPRLNVSKKTITPMTYAQCCHSLISSFRGIIGKYQRKNEIQSLLQMKLATLILLRLN